MDNIKYQRSSVILSIISKKMSDVHAAKVGKFFTVQQEKRLTVLRARAVIIGYYRYMLLRDNRTSISITK
jgi:hypothetical protein